MKNDFENSDRLSAYLASCHVDFSSELEFAEAEPSLPDCRLQPGHVPPANRYPQRAADHLPGTILIDRYFDTLIVVLAWAPHIAPLGFPAPFLTFGEGACPYLVVAGDDFDADRVLPGALYKHSLDPLACVATNSVRDHDGYIQLTEDGWEFVTSRLDYADEKWAVNLRTWTVSPASPSNCNFVGRYAWDIQVADDFAMRYFINSIGPDD